MILFLLLSILPLISLIISVYNFFTIPRLENKKFNDDGIKISVLIPARNEEANIDACLNSVCSQNYKNLEIIILDDDSGDNTFSVAEKFSLKDNRVRVIKGKNLAAGWVGKNWACKQLSDNAQGDFLLFIDADVRLMPEAIESAMSALEETNVDMMSVFPKQIMNTTGEKVTVGIITWLMLAFLPVKQIYKSKSMRFSGAVGQFMMWKRESYFRSGGHESVKDKIVEDMETAKFLKRKGFKIILLLSDGLVQCRMYGSFKEGVDGFTKNAYPSTNSSAAEFFAILFFISASLLLPLLLAAANHLYFYTLAVIILHRIIVSVIYRENILTGIILYPVQIIVMDYIAIRSYTAFKKNRLNWKERNLQKAELT